MQLHVFLHCSLLLVVSSIFCNTAWRYFFCQTRHFFCLSKRQRRNFIGCNQNQNKNFFLIFLKITGLESLDFLGLDIMMAVIPLFVFALTRLLVSTSSCNLAILFSSSRILPCNASLIADKWLTLEGESLQKIILTCFDILPTLFENYSKCRIFLHFFILLTCLVTLFDCKLLKMSHLRFWHFSSNIC